MALLLPWIFEDYAFAYLLLLGTGFCGFLLTCTFIAPSSGSYTQEIPTLKQKYFRGAYDLKIANYH